LTRKMLGPHKTDVAQKCPDNLRPCAFVQPTAGMHGAKLQKRTLTIESAGSESLQEVGASVPAQNRVCTSEICHRGGYASVYGGQKIGVNLTGMRPRLYRGHTRDLSPIIDIAG